MDKKIVFACAISGLIAGIAGAGVAYFFCRSPKRERRLTDVYKEDIQGDCGTDYVPPLPPQVKQLLSSANLAHLTCKDGLNAPHACLMNFTFVADEEDVLVMTTRRDTKKFKLMQGCDQVSVLIHDFPQVKDTEASQGKETQSFNRTLSLMIEGRVRIETDARANTYRDIHLKKNGEYRQFIEGPDKAVVTVKIIKCRMCNIQDQVTTWDSKTSGS